ncbi:MAG: response regulator transcription factor [Xanthobacteraceae bacterium]|nr:response regulator transcription factor [Xanthobacteraceae bacterium]
MKQKTRIVLADDHPIVLAGLRNLILAEADLEVVGEAANGGTAFATIRDTRPHVAVLDISMGVVNGILLTRRLMTEMPSIGVLILTLHEDRAFIRQGFDAGARGYVLKRSAAECLVQGIRAVAVGGLYADPAIASKMFDVIPKHPGRGGAGAAFDLTEREGEVLKLVALGFTNKEIAQKLGIGLKSVETYKGRGTEKLGVSTRADLVRYAAGQGWLIDAS